MAQSFSYDLSVPGAPSDAHTRLKGTVVERMRVAGSMRLVSEDASSLTFRPRWTFPVLLAAARTIGGETVRVSFAAAGDGQTQVAVSGKVGASVKRVGTREFWAETLQAP